MLGVSPAGLVGKTWKVGRESMAIAYDVEINGRQATIDTKLVLSLSRYNADDTPTKGAVLQDQLTGTQFKIVTITRDDLGVALSLECSSRYQGA